MNIGIVTTWFERGAAYVSRQYRQVLEDRHEVFIYARGGEEYGQNKPNWDNPHVTWGKRLPFVGKSFIDRADFYQWLQHNRIDLVIFNEQDWWPPVLWCNEWGILTGGYVDYYTEDTVPFFACYDFLLCNTQRHYSVFNWHPQVCYAPWGTDTQLFRPQSLEPLDDEGIIFFHSSGMSPHRKGTDLIIRAFDDLVGDARLIIHAQKPLEQQLPELSAQIEKLRTSDRLIYQIETVPAPGLYHLGDVYVYPSRLDGIGLTVAEALACGLPVITTNHPPMNEFVQPPVNGQLVAVERLIARADGYYWPQAIVQVDDLARAMQFYIDHRAELTQFKQLARQYADTHLTWSHNAAHLPAWLEQVEKQPATGWKAVHEDISAYERKRTSLPQMYPRFFYGLHLAWQPIKAMRKALNTKS